MKVMVVIDQDYDPEVYNMPDDVDDNVALRQILIGRCNDVLSDEPDEPEYLRIRNYLVQGQDATDVDLYEFFGICAHPQVVDVQEVPTCKL